MKILIVINNLDTGGAERLLVNMIPMLVSNNIAVDVALLSGKNYPFLNELEDLKCCKIISLGNGNIYNPLLILKLIPLLSKYNIIHVHLFPSLYWVAFAKLLSFSTTPLVYTEHSTKNRRRSSNFYKVIDRFIYKQYTTIVVVSTEVKLLLKKHLASKRTNFKTISNGIELSLYQNSKPIPREVFTKNPMAKIVIQVASFTNEKDYETLIRAIRYVQFPIVLLLIGEGENRASMQLLVNELGLTKKIRFLGMRKDVPALLKTADIAVLASNQEGLSLSSLEAMASGTPLIASNVSGLKTLVHGAGLLYRHKDEIDLADKLNSLYSDSNLYKETSNYGIKRVRKFKLSTMVNAHIELYREICQK